MTPLSLEFTLIGGLALALIAALLASLSTRAIIPWLKRTGTIDTPNARSSHVQPTPRGAGLCTSTLIFLGLLPLSAFTGSLPAVAPLVIAGLLLTALSFADDRWNLSPLIRLAGHFVAVMLGLSFFDQHVVFPENFPVWLDRSVAAFLWLWAINLFNFMDGIDGIAGTEALIIGLGSALCGLIVGAAPVVVLGGFLVLGVSAGFLRWNWSPARVFLGDSGSVPLGFVCGWLMLSLSSSGAWAAALIVPLYFLADATTTLVKRLLRGEAIWRAHREHYYQRAHQNGFSHAAISLHVGFLGALLVALACVSLLVPGAAISALVVACAALLLVLWRFTRAR